MTRALIGQCDRAVRFSAGFFEARAPQSMVRAVALLFALAAIRVSLAACALSARPHLVPDHVAAIGELTKLTTLLVAGGAVALLSRTRSTAPAPLPEG
jgi:hypothetical protein